MSDSRSKLMAAAAEEFAKYGLQGARIHAIVARAGVNDRMIYHHFGSKENLYIAVLDDQRAGLTQAWSPCLEKAASVDAYEGMRIALNGLFEILLARPLLLSLLLHEALSGWQRLSIPPTDQLLVPLSGLYELGQRSGVFRADCPFERAYATAMGALFAQRIFAPRLADMGWDSDTLEVRDQVVGQLLDGMTGPASARPDPTN
jgi:AcrR family transcriptional regulator